MYKYDTGRIEGQWQAFERLLSHINTIETSRRTGEEVRKELYHYVMALKPR